jgi:hypothetical protein
MILKTETHQWLFSFPVQVAQNHFSYYVATNPDKRAYWKSGSRYEHVRLPGYKLMLERGWGKGVAAARLKRLVWCHARDSPSCARSCIQSK